MVVDNIDEIEKFDNKIKYSFDSIWFHKINRHKVDRVVPFWFGYPKEKGCMIGGIKGDRLLFPYSSPFSMLEWFKECRNEELESCVDEVDQYCVDSGIRECVITLPPMIYDEKNITKWLACLLRAGYSVQELGLNFHIEMCDKDEYSQRLLRNGKKNLNHALNENYSFCLCSTEEEKKQAYDIICENRKSKGYYLRMTWKDIEETITKMGHDFFVLEHNGVKIAAAMVFSVTSDINQVVYWGDIQGYEEARPMNYLPYAMNRYYYDKGIRILDIGPSMLDGRPNYSLCDYKESIGCNVSGKYILKKEFLR